MRMKKVTESIRLNEWVKMIKKWLKKNDRDDDFFNHPFAIF